jgi:SAM-dependent methyltransferase
MKRVGSYGENKRLSILDKFGEILSGRSISKTLKHARSHDSLGDIGAGFNGNITRPYWHSFGEIHLFDLSLNCEQLKSLNKNIYCHEGDVIETTANFKGELDFVVMNNLLEHINEPVQLLSQIKLILPEGGSLHINVPSWKGKIFLELAAFTFNLAPREEMEDHKRYYSKRELWLELRKAGFMPSKIKIKKNKFGLNILAAVRN